MVSTIFHLRVANLSDVGRQVGFYVGNAVLSVLIAHFVSRVGVHIRERWRARRRRTVCRARSEEKGRGRDGKRVASDVDRTLGFDWPPRQGKSRPDAVETETVEKQRDRDGKPPARRRPRR
jgi:hypothetical protein